MKARQVYLGIDFGTSNSSIAYVVADPRDASAKKIDVKTVRVQMDDEGNATTDRIPTIVSLNFDDRRSKMPLLGWEFIQQFRQSKRKSQLLRHGQTFFRSIKSDLGTFRTYPHAFAKDFPTPEHVAAAIMRRLVEEARKKLPGCDLRGSHVVVTVPASLCAVAREQTLAAAQLAGLDRELVELVDEPVAALLDFVNDGRAAGLLQEDRPKNLLVFDYGGGTLDVSLVRARFDSKSQTGLKVENLAISQYRRLGGDDVDRAVMDKVVWPKIEADLGKAREELPSQVRQMLEDTLIPTVARGLKENICRRIESRQERTNRKRGGQAVTAFEPLHRSFDIPEMSDKLPTRFSLSSGEFESLMAPFLEVPEDDSDDWERDCPQSLLVPVLEVLDRGGLKPSELHAIILHGGSCRNPLVHSLLEEVFAGKYLLFGNAQILETPELDASVARGAALAGYWRHARNVEIVPPIIAEEIGVLTLNDKPVKLLDSGHLLPFPDENGVYEIPCDFYVPIAGARQLLVPVYTSRQQKLAESVKVELPSTANRGDTVKIKLRVERDKTLQWWFSVGGGDSFKAPVVQNPWTAHKPTPAEERIQQHRREMREHLLKNGELPAWMEFADANYLYQAASSKESPDDAALYDEAELATQDFIANHGLTARAANLMGLICGMRGRPDERLRWHEQATKLDPKDAVLCGNYGYALADAGRHSEGEAMMRQALTLDPSRRYLYTRLGDLYRERGDEEAAQKEFREAIRLVERETGSQPESGAIWRAAEALHRRVGDYDRAAEAQRRAVTVAQNERFGGDSATRIAGPDSGFLQVDERT
jgi:molecular chaperone DnaK (HSP70)